MIIVVEEVDHYFPWAYFDGVSLERQAVVVGQFYTYLITTSFRFKASWEGDQTTMQSCLVSNC